MLILGVGVVFSYYHCSCFNVHFHTIRFPASLRLLLLRFVEQLDKTTHQISAVSSAYRMLLVLNPPVTTPSI